MLVASQAGVNKECHSLCEFCPKRFKSPFGLSTIEKWIHRHNLQAPFPTNPIDSASCSSGTLTITADIVIKQECQVVLDNILKMVEGLKVQEEVANTL